MNDKRATTRRLAGSAAVALAVTIVLLMIAVRPRANHGDDMGLSFLLLQMGFTQELFGVVDLTGDPLDPDDDGILGGVAFRPTDADPLVTECVFTGSPLHRFNRQGVVSPDVHGSELHPEAPVTSSAGCGLVNHFDGTLYSNIDNGTNGIVNLTIGGGVIRRFGPRGNALSIAVNPVSQHIFYGGLDCGAQDSAATCTIYEVSLSSNPPLVTTFATLNATADASFIDGLYFDPTGNFLFIATRETLPNTPTLRLTILDNLGQVVQHVPMVSEPDGVAFHVTAPQFVVTNNTDGTMTRFDFPGNNYSIVPGQMLFASGGFRGDLLQVGSDGCIYLTQAMTRHDDGVITTDNSLVRICGGFAPPAAGSDPPAQDPVVVLKKTTSTIVKPGNPLHYKITYTNGGPAASHGAKIIDYLPANVTFLWASHGGTFDPGSHTVTWELGTVPYNATGSVDLHVGVPPTTALGTVIVNRADFTGILTVSPPTATALTTVVERP